MLAQLLGQLEAALEVAASLRVRVFLKHQPTEPAEILSLANAVAIVAGDGEGRAGALDGRVVLAELLQRLRDTPKQMALCPRVANNANQLEPRL